jgi:hypothetical protein
MMILLLLVHTAGFAGYELRQTSVEGEVLSLSGRGQIGYAAVAQDYVWSLWDRKIEGGLYYWAQGVSRFSDGAYRVEFEKVGAFVRVPFKYCSFSAGLLEVAWGESRIVPLSDVVNARNITHRRGLYDPAAKIPTPMIKADAQVGAFSAEIVSVPDPMPTREPDEIAGFGVAVSDPNDPEYGGRVRAVSGALDASVYYFRHSTRIPSYVLTPFAGEKDIVRVSGLQETIGASAAYSGAEWIGYGEIALHVSEPTLGIGVDKERTDLLQSMAGATYAPNEAASFGLELYWDHWQKAPEGYDEGAFVESEGAPLDLYWLGTSFRRRSGSLGGELLGVGLLGMNSNERLLRLSWNQDLTSAMTGVVEWANTDSAGRSPKALLIRHNSYSLRITYRI